MSRSGEELGEEVWRWLEATTFSEEVKSLAGALTSRINHLLHTHMMQCKQIRVAKDDCCDAQILAIATVLKMHQELAKDRQG